LLIILFFSFSFSFSPFSLDKFYLLLRKFLYHTFRLLADREFDSEWTSAVVRVLESLPLRSPSTRKLASTEMDPSVVPDGVRFHVVGVFTEELVRALAVRLFDLEFFFFFFLLVLMLIYFYFFLFLSV
jgi:hypothetical protein